MIKKTLYGLLFLAVLCGGSSCKKEVNQVPATHEENIQTSGKKKNRSDAQGWTKFWEVHPQASRVVIAIGHRDEQNKIKWGKLGFMWYSILRLNFPDGSSLIHPLWIDGIFPKANDESNRIDLTCRDNYFEYRRKDGSSFPQEVIGVRLFQLNDPQEKIVDVSCNNKNLQNPRSEKHFNDVTYEMIGKMDQPKGLDDLKKKGFIVSSKTILF